MLICYTSHYYLINGLLLNRSTFALFVALLIHLLIFLLVWIFIIITPDLSQKKPEEKKVKISLKELPVKHKESGLKKEKTPPKEPEIAPPMPKGSQLEKIVKAPPVEYKPKKPKVEPKLNKPQKSVPKPTPKPKVEPLPPQKPFVPLLEKKEEPKEKQEPAKEDPFAWLHEDKSSEESEKKVSKSTESSNVSSNLKELYGEEFGKLSAGQQKYLLDNQEIMRRITQQVLNRVASVNLNGSLRVNSSNVIEFYLHPNGDMSDFKFLTKSGYYELDDTTRETIEYAYAKYPRPSEKTLIRYNVFYHLARH